MSAVPAGARPEALSGFGLYNFCVAPVYRPRSVDELADLLRELNARGLRYVFRGNGRSYGDAALCTDGAIVELLGLSRILGLDEETGVVTMEPGVTYEALWRHVLPKGFWPPVVPGTMFATLGGCLAANIHGKNGWRRGTLAEHVESVTVLCENGQRLRVERGDPAMLDVVSRFRSPRPIVEIALKLKRVESGFVDVEAVPTKDLAEMLELLDATKESFEYVVGWIDCFPGGSALGRGAAHLASYAKPAGAGKNGFTMPEQLEGRLSDLVPKALLLAILKASASDTGMRFVNAAKFAVHRLTGRRRYREPLVAFSFLLDFVPAWREMYRPGGFIQYQLFMPKEKAREAYTEALRLQREIGVFSYLAVVKRHRAEALPLRNAYALDGYSLALDFPVTDRNAGRLVKLCRRYDELALRHGGNVYRAKDCVGSWERISARRRAAE